MIKPHDKGQLPTVPNEANPELTCLWSGSST